MIAYIIENCKYVHDDESREMRPWSARLILSNH